MVDHPRYANSQGDSTGNDTSLQPDHGLTDSTPRWVKVFGIIVLVVVLLFVILHLAGGGFGHHTQ